MKSEIIDKKSGSRRDAENIQQVVLDRPSIIFLKLAPESVARYERRGDDMVLILKDGQEIPILGFFVKYPSEDSAEQASADDGNVSNDEAPAEEYGRNELVLEDDNGVAWWGQYPEQWSEFHFTEIEWNDDGGFIWWPWLLGALGVGGLGASLGGDGDGGRARPPVASDDAATTDEDTPVSGNVLGNDSDPDGDALTVTSFTVAGDPTVYTAGTSAAIAGVGTLSLGSDGGYTFTPVANYNGLVPTVTYTISDGEGGSDTADLVITVDPVTDLRAADDSNTTDEDTPVTGTVVTNDSTTSGGDLTYAKTSDPTNGTVVVNSDGTYTYTPNANYNGPDSFTYTVTDPDSGESLTQSVTITVNPINDAPEPVGVITDQASEDAQDISTLDVTTFFDDVEGDTLTYSASGLPEGLTIDPVTGEISGTIDPSASQDGTGGVHNVTITASDGNGGSTTQSFTWTVTNPAPVANDDAASTDEDTSVSGNVLTGTGTGDVADSD
ncbi:MAG: Ig-like domain-containing protein, partial [Parasphingorhabdus sp.]